MKLRSLCRGPAVALVSVALYAPRASAQDTHSLEEYAAMAAHADATFSEWRAADEAEPRWADLAGGALRERLALITYLSAWTDEGTMPAEMVQDAAHARAYLYQNIVTIYAELGRCDAAQTTADQLLRYSAEIEMGTEAEPLILESTAAVTQCELRSAEAVVEVEVPPAAAETTHPRWALVGAGGALLLGGLAYDLTRATSADRTNLSTCRDDAGAAGCDLDTADTTIDRIESSRPVTAGLVATGLVSIAAGILWPVREPAPRAVTWSLTPGGITVSGRF